MRLVDFSNYSPSSTHFFPKMDAQYVSALEETLRQTQVPDSAAIKQAVARLLKDFFSNAAAAIPALLHILQLSTDEAVQQLAAVEVRKLILLKWRSEVDAATKQQIRPAMLAAVFDPKYPKKVQHSIARVVATIGEIDLEDDQWGELLPALVDKISGAAGSEREMAVYTLYTLLETQIPSLVPHVADFLALFATLLVDSSSQDIRINAVMAMDVLLQFIDEDVEINTQLAAKFQQTVPAMINVLKEVISASSERAAKDIFSVFNNLIFVDVKLVGDHLLSLIELTIEVALNADIDEEYRVFSLQFLISCVSLRKSKILLSKIAPQMTLAALKIASEEIDVDEELNSETEENENEENEPPTLALRLIAMLAAELPPSQVVVPLLGSVQQMVTGSTNQFERRAALLSIGVAAAGAPDFVAAQAKKLVPLLQAGLTDSELVVRVAALRTLTSLTAELQDTIATYHEELLPPVIAIIDSADSIKAYKYGCYAMDGLIEYMSHDVVAKYLEALMNKLIQMLQLASSSSLRAAIVSAIGSTAYASGKSFTPYFNGSIQILEPFLTNASLVQGMSEDDVELRALTFENISTMARAVGSEAFAQYAPPLVEAAYQSLSLEHWRIRESGFAFITNMARVYGKEFAGFLERIVPEILKCLEQDEFTFNEGDEAEEDDEEEDIDNKFNVHTGITIEKEIASVALAELATGTGKQFAPYVEASLKTLLQQIEESYGMREAAMNAIWKILTAMFKAQVGDDFDVPKGVPQHPYVDASIMAIVQQVRDTSITSLEEEFDLTMVACILDNLAEATHALGPIAIISGTNDTQNLEKLCVQLVQILKKEHPCQVEEEEVPNDEDEDNSSETDALLFESTVEVLIGLAGALGPDFVKIFTGFKDILIASSKSKSKNKRVSSTGALAEIASGMKGALTPYVEELMQVFMDRLPNDKSLEVRGNAAYGVGILIEHSTNDLSSIYNNVLQLLFQLLNKTERRAANHASDDDDESKDVVNRSYANACGCVARMALKNESAVPLAHVLGPLLDHLPLETGFEENEPIFTLITKLYSQGNDLITQHTQRVVDMFAVVFTKEFERVKLVSESTLGREENLDRLKQFANDDIKNEVIKLLRFLDNKYSGIVSSNEVLKAVI